MTLCKFRPPRNYDAQLLIDMFDLDGLEKRLHEKIAELGEQGMVSTMYYVGALTALQTLAVNAERDGMVDYPDDFMRKFDKALGELGGGE